MKKKFTVTLTKIYNGSVTVEAENEEQAIQIVQGDLDEYAPDDAFSFGEITADDAEPLNEE